MLEIALETSDALPANNTVFGTCEVRGSRKILILVDEPGDAEFLRAALDSSKAFHSEVRPVSHPSGKVYVELTCTRRGVNYGFGLVTADGRAVPGFTENQSRAAVAVDPGKTVKVRLVADSPADQLWVELTVAEVPGRK